MCGQSIMYFGILTLVQLRLVSLPSLYKMSGMSLLNLKVVSILVSTTTAAGTFFYRSCTEGL